MTMDYRIDGVGDVVVDEHGIAPESSVARVESALSHGRLAHGFKRLAVPLEQDVARRRSVVQYASSCNILEFFAKQRNASMISQ